MPTEAPVAAETRPLAIGDVVEVRGSKGVITSIGPFVHHPCVAHWYMKSPLYREPVVWIELRVGAVRGTLMLLESEVRRAD